MTSELKDGIGSLTPATESAKFIKAIDKTTVHRICSGQVVLTLSIAVKELVENSIDAGATSVEVRLKDYGASLLEVCDNGKGVEEENFEGLTLKHHTSKLQDFGDLVGVKTFGFRGEALSSLCALSNLSVTTRHNSQAVGAKLVYDHNGKLTSKVATSRQVGMTVSLQNLFSTLPVRHKEFQRNIKKEFAKMVQILYSYCLISTGVRITCTNQTEKGKKTVVVATDGHSTIRENISSVFGAKQVSSVIEFKQENASSDMLSEYGLRTEANSQGDSLFTLEGFISSCAHGQGRSASDRQFYFINSRPCDPTKVMKLVNEVYHYYNRHQFPFIVLDIHLKQDDVDVNVTPDKRQILVNHEKLLLATLKTSITRLYENIPSTYSMQNTSFSSPLNRSFSSPQSSSSPNSNASSGKTSSLALKFGRNLGCSPLSQSSGSLPSSPSVSGMKRSFSQDSSESTKKQPKLESFFQNKSPSSGSFDSTTKNSIAILPNSSNDIPSSSQSSGVELNGSLMECVGEMEEEETSDKNSFIRTDLELNALPSKSGTEDAIIPDGHQIEDGIGDAIDADTEDCSNQVMNYKKMSVGQDNSSDISDIQSLKENTPPEYSPSSSQFIDTQEIGLVSDIGNNKLLETKSNVISALSKFSRPSVTASPSCKKAQNATNAFLNNLMARKSDVKKSNPERQEVKVTTELEAIPCESEENEAETMEVENDICGGTDNRSSPLKKLVVVEEYNPEDYKAHRKTKCIDFSIESLREKINKSLESKEEKSLTRRFHAKIAPTDNQSAEDELKKEISKDMFTEMEVLGQFNLGFIIAKLGSDLFIVDQHATDEKYNFETLQQTCVLQNQRLIVPQLLELTAVNESILLDNIEIFKKNGFEFKIEEEETVGRRVSLTSMPFSRGWEFGREDIDELIFMLSDSPGHMCRPSRVRAMFASRSCRKSVMIGTALTNVQMRKLLIHMGEIEQPWNCPHGRPTMRHLVNIDMILATQD